MSPCTPNPRTFRKIISPPSVFQNLHSFDAQKEPPPLFLQGQAMPPPSSLLKSLDEIPSGLITSHMGLKAWQTVFSISSQSICLMFIQQYSIHYVFVYIVYEQYWIELNYINIIHLNIIQMYMNFLSCFIQFYKKEGLDQQGRN